MKGSGGEVLSIGTGKEATLSGDHSCPLPMSTASNKNLVWWLHGSHASAEAAEAAEAFFFLDAAGRALLDGDTGRFEMRLVRGGIGLVHADPIQHTRAQALHTFNVL